MHTAYYTLHIAHITHCTLYTAHRTLLILHCTLHIYKKAWAYWVVSMAHSIAAVELWCYIHCTAQLVMLYTLLHCNAIYIALHNTLLYCAALHCAVSARDTLHYISLHCISLHCIVLHCSALYCTTLHYTTVDYTGSDVEAQHEDNVSVITAPSRAGRGVMAGRTTHRGREGELIKQATTNLY